MEKHKVLSHSKIHKYLKMFSDMGLLVRRRLPKRGNYVEYHLNTAYASEHPILQHFYSPDRSYYGPDWPYYGPQIYDIPILVYNTIQRQKMFGKKRAKKKLQADWEKYMKPVRFLTTKMMLSSVMTEDGPQHLGDYQLLHDLAPHKPLEAMYIIIGLEQQRFCPSCLKRISLQKYLREGVDCIPRLIRIKEENRVYCPKCYYESQYGPLSPRKNFYEEG